MEVRTPAIRQARENRLRNHEQETALQRSRSGEFSVETNFSVEIGMADLVVKFFPP